MNRYTKTLVAATACVSIGVPAVEACTRILYKTGEGTYITGRNMDWAESPGSDLWVFPRGIDRAGAADDNPVTWTSKYASIVTSFYGIASVDGMNEKGLVMNGLYLTQADYGSESRADLPGMSIGAYGQYLLDNFATVKEAVDEIGKDKIRVVAPVFPNGKAATGHISISDASGDSAIFEYIDGELQIHHSPKYVVMTNDPVYRDQLAITTYWDEVGGWHMLPGTVRPADRFARASFFVKETPNFEKRSEAVAAVYSMMRGVSVPLGIKDPDKPNISTTVWRTVADQDKLRYFYESSYTPNTFWVDLKKFDLSKNGSVKKLELDDGNPIYAGEVSAKFKDAKPFPFLSE